MLLLYIIRKYCQWLRTSFRFFAYKCKNYFFLQNRKTGQKTYYLNREYIYNFCPAMKRDLSLGRDIPIKFLIVFLSGSEADKLNSYGSNYIEHVFVCQYTHKCIQNIISLHFQMLVKKTSSSKFSS